MFNIILATNKVPILFDENGNEYIFNKYDKIIRIYNIGHFTPIELEKYGKIPMEENEFYYINNEIVLHPFTNNYFINKVFIEDYDKINNYKSINSIKKYNLKTSQPNLIKYLENFKIQKIKEIKHNKEIQRKQLNKKLLKPQQPTSNEITFNLPPNLPNNKIEWLKSSLPYRSPNKIKELYINNFGKKDISINDIKQNVEHYNNFNIKQNQKKFSLKTYSNIFHSFIGDIFYESNKAAFLLLININTRKAYAYQLGEINYKNEIDLVDGVEKIVYQYATKGKKTTSELIKAFNKHLLNEKINILKFDNESAIKSLEFQQFLKDHNIKFIKTIPNSHTSLSIIDRLCRTIRDIAFNLGYELILTQKQMNTILNYYNNTRHEGLTKILRKKVCPNDLSNNPDLEKQYVIECKKYNLLIMNQKDFELNKNDEVKIVNDNKKLTKKRSILSKDHYKVIGYNGNLIKLLNLKNGKIEYKPRFFILLNDERNKRNN